jgi:hypothetical protein
MVSGRFVVFEVIEINRPSKARRSLKVDEAMTVAEGKLTQTPPGDPGGRQSIAKVSGG